MAASIEPRFLPSDDGKTHLNVYSKGATALGRALTNFASTPFDLDGKRFGSVEGWWYWRMTGDERVAGMHGFMAKERGRQLPPVESIPPSRDLLKRVYQAKLDAHPGLRDQVMQSELPFDHYFVYGGARKETQWRWTGQLWNEIRDELRGALAMERACGAANRP